MVHVAAPAGWRADGATSSAERSVIADDSALAVSTTASLIIPADFAADLSTTMPTPELPAAEAADPVPVAAQASSHLAIYAVAGAAAILVGGLGLAWAMWPANGTQDDEAPTAAVAVKEDSAQSQPKAAAPSPPNERLKSSVSDSQAADHPKDSAVPTLPPIIQPVTSPPAADSKPNVATASTASVQSAPPAEARTEHSKAPIPPKTAAVAESAPARPIDVSPKTIEPVESAPDHSPVLKFDPLDFDPNRLSVGYSASVGSKTSTSSIPEQTSSEPAGDHEAAKAASAGGAQPDEKVQAARDMLPPAAANQSIAVRRGEPADGSRPQNAGQRLALRVKAFQVSDMPLARFLDTLGNLAGTGITLDPVAMELVGTSARTGVTVNAEDTTLDKILSDGVNQQRLQRRRRGRPNARCAA